MKKLIFICLLCMITLSSCAQVVVKNVYQKTYKSAQSEIAYKDIYGQLKTYGVDSLNLDKWLTNQMVTNDTTTVIQKIVRKDIDKDNNYMFIFTQYKYPKSSMYQITVRETKKGK